MLGAVIGAAVGDALGHPTEFLSTTQLHAKYGPNGVTGFELWWEVEGRRFAPYTDDTQMAEIVLQALVDKGGPDASLEAVMLEIATGFAHWIEHPQGGHRAPGNACVQGARRLENGVTWREAGGATAGGCGSVMRAYPFGLRGTIRGELEPLLAPPVTRPVRFALLRIEAPMLLTSHRRRKIWGAGARTKPAPPGSLGRLAPLRGPRPSRGRWLGG